MSKFQELQDKHIVLLQSYERHQESPELLKDIKEYTEQVVNGSREIGNSRERNQLRANLRFWGAYIYDHTGIYPNLDLLPSEAIITDGGIVAGKMKWGIPLLLLFLVVVFLGWFGFWRTHSWSLSSQIIIQATPTLPNVFPLPSVENPMAMIEEFARQTSVVQTAVASNGTPDSSQITATVGAAFTQAASAIITPQAVFSTSTAIVSNPPTGFVPGIKVSSVGIDATTPEGESEITCPSQREITITWQDLSGKNQKPNWSAPEDAMAYLSRPGSGAIAPQTSIAPNGNSAVIKLDNSKSNETYFLQVKHSSLMFQPVIIYFTNCLENNMAITYSGSSDTKKTLNLDIDLVLLDWGPASQIQNYSWIAQFVIKHDEGGIYMYLSPDSQGQIIEGPIYVRGMGCFSKPFKISRASNGKYEEVEISLYVTGPLCPASNR